MAPYGQNAEYVLGYSHEKIPENGQGYWSATLNGLSTESFGATDDQYFMRVNVLFLARIYTRAGRDLSAGSGVAQAARQPFAGRVRVVISF